jgi:hypothetical protein
MNKFSKYVGLDVHQETIAVAVADMGGPAATQFADSCGTSSRIARSWRRRRFRRSRANG